MFLERPETVYFRKLGKHSSAPTWQTDRSTLGNVRVACKHTHMHVLTCAASGSGNDPKWAFSIYSSAWGNSSSMATPGLTFIMQAPCVVLWLWWASSLITGCVTSSSALLTRMATEEPQRPVVNSPSQITHSPLMESCQEQRYCWDPLPSPQKGKGPLTHSVGLTACSPRLGGQLQANCLALAFMPLTDPTVPVATWQSTRYAPFPASSLPRQS